MKRLRTSLLVLTTMILASSVALANGTIKAPYTGKQAYIAYKPKAPRLRLKTAVFHPGSLRMNIIQNARRFGWRRVIWTATNDYRWVSYTRVKSRSLQGILRKVLMGYPVQAIFYQGNHVLVIKPRTLK